MKEILKNIFGFAILAAGIGIVIVIGPLIGTIMCVVFFGYIAINSLYIDKNGKVKVIELPGGTHGDDDC